ncbi:Gfo/Idh/MocA family oxidoreductase [bacterium]|nr:Gfo/Idh/MocA family oxidoreductase [bacterium]
MGNVRVGIIGFGGMGSHHAKYLSQGEINGAELVAACDVKPERLEYATKTFGDGIATFASADELFAAECCDAVMIATPHYFHPPIAVQAFEQGLHVLSEKPAGVYTRQVREMNEAADASGKVFALMFNQRTRAVYKKLKDLIEGGELGELMRTNWIITSWFRAQSYYDSGGWRATWAGEGGGVLANQCPHNLDLWQWCCGMPTRVRAFCHFGKWHDIEVEDDATAYVEYANGATGVFVTGTGDAPGTNRLEVTGDQGKIVVEGGTLEFWRNRQSARQFSREFKGGFGEPECWKVDVPVGRDGRGHTDITQSWIDAIRDGKPLIADGREGIRSVEIANAMILSAWTDGWVDVPVDEALFFEELQKRNATSSYQGEETGKAMDVDGTF